MKKLKYLGLAVLCGAFALAGCSGDDVDAGKSVLPNLASETNVFDTWLLKNYVENYNIDYIYRYEDKETNFSYYLVPAELEKSMKLAKIIKHAWLEAYVEVAGIDFMRKNAPGMLQVIGSAAWDPSSSTMLLGTAEGGLKITLYLVNWLNEHDIEEMNKNFFHTMHHEFTHILQQTTNYPQEYNLISQAHYLPSGWHNRSPEEAAKLGFITNYAGSSAVEDITEITACYITNSDAANALLFSQAGDQGGAIIRHKQDIMKKYMKEIWKIDMDQLRNVVNRRMKEVLQMQLIEPEWRPLLGSSSGVATTALSVVKADLLKMIGEENEEVIKARAQKHSTACTCQIHSATLLNQVK